MTRLQRFVIAHTDRGECKCGHCVDRGDKPEPSGHTADMIFFKVAKIGDPSLEKFKQLTMEHKGEFGQCNPFDGNEHNYIEIGAWIGDQGVGLGYMALGVLLGGFALLTPRTMLDETMDDSFAMKIAMAGFVAIQVQA